MFQPKYPLNFSEIDGAYESIKDIKENIKQNATFLLSISPGEWPNNPEIGCGIRRFLFSNHSSQEMYGIHKAIKDQFSRYLPFLEVKSELIEEDSYGNNLIDENEIKLIVRYNIRPLNVQDFVEIGISE